MTIADSPDCDRASVVEEAKKYIQQQPVVGSDETSFDQGNIDGCNPNQRQAWLWGTYDRW